MNREVGEGQMLWFNEIGSWDVHFEIGTGEETIDMFMNDTYQCGHIIEFGEKGMRIGLNSVRWNKDNNWGWE